MTSSAETPSVGRRRVSVVHLLAALAAMFVVLPFIDTLRYGELIESVAFTVVLLAAVGAVGGRRRTLIAAVVLAAPTVIARWCTHTTDAQLPNDLSLIAGMVFVTFVAVHLFRYVLRAPEVDAEVLCAAIAIYLLFAVDFSFFYTLLARWEPGSFEFTYPRDAGAKLAGFMALYYSIQVLTTITFGDILPVTNVARMLSLVEGAVGLFYLAILISRLVGIYSAGNAEERGGGASQVSGDV
ncbi:Ion channel [Pirellulimonas nuda]|uniref:Ion channel n=1 Tax=Pirellulimonas nuda TaxID=2528009 RepID=A0A518DJB1_9BACT|nr:potassium channel family protein [Pirellulimonas nuda]QDU91536.1 Ion channel [Pirellulimonas nuda]